MNDKYNVGDSEKMTTDIIKWYERSKTLKAKESDSHSKFYQKGENGPASKSIDLWWRCSV